MECSANARIRHVKQHRVYRSFSQCRCQRNFSRSLLSNLSRTTLSTPSPGTTMMLVPPLICTIRRRNSSCCACVRRPNAQWSDRWSWRAYIGRSTRRALQAQKGGRWWRSKHCNNTQVATSAASAAIASRECHRRFHVSDGAADKCQTVKNKLKNH